MKRYTPEFRAEALKQITERRYAVSDVAKRLGVSGHSLYAWLREAGVSRADAQAKEDVDLRAENARLRAALKRAEEDRDILKKAAAYFAKTSG